MPWVSEAQRKWGNSPAGHKALGSKGVAEWNNASKGKALPSRASKHIHHGKSGGKKK
jgi:hypothetical protein